MNRMFAIITTKLLPKIMANATTLFVLVPIFMFGYNDQYSDEKGVYMSLSSMNILEKLIVVWFSLMAVRIMVLGFFVIKIFSIIIRRKCLHLQHTLQLL